MNKQTSELLENVLFLKRKLNDEIKEKEIEIRIIEAKIEQLYTMIDNLELIAELESKRLSQEAVENE